MRREWCEGQALAFGENLVDLLCPLTTHGKLVNRIVVVLTFDKNGKVR